MKNSKLVIIEVPLQCLLLEAAFGSYHSLTIKVLKRKNWPAPVMKMQHYLREYDVKVHRWPAIICAVILCRLKYRELVVGSHLGKFNKLLIGTGLILGYQVRVLDDGLYGLRSPDWMIKLMKAFPNLVWHSYFYRKTYKTPVASFCMINTKANRTARNTLFFVLSDFKSHNISKTRETEIFQAVRNLALHKGMELQIIPHRRSRLELYEQCKKVRYTNDIICFEDWYLKTKFVNCAIAAYSSSIWRVLEDKRTETLLIDLGLPNIDWIEADLPITQKIEA